MPPAERHDADAGPSADDAPELLASQPPQPELPPDPALEALRASGAQRMDPVRFRYLEAMERRCAAQPGAALQERLARQLAESVAAYRAQWDAERAELERLVPGVLQRHPQAEPALRRLHAESDLRALRRLAARLDAEQQRRNGPLAELLRRLDGQGEPDASNAPVTRTQARVPNASAPPAATAPMADLKTVQRFRETWARLRVDEQLARSQQQAPDNPGPLNSHLLVLRALRSLQDLSPAYLSRFVAQAEALMWLDGAGVRKPAASGGAPVRGRAGRRRKPGSG